MELDRNLDMKDEMRPVTIEDVQNMLVNDSEDEWSAQESRFSQPLQGRSCTPSPPEHVYEFIEFVYNKKAVDYWVIDTGGKRTFA